MTGPTRRAGLPTISVDFEPRFCGNHVADSTAGCSFSCIYCPFSAIAARRHGVSRPVALAADRIEALPAPPTLFLSPASDAFAPQAVEGTNRLLRHVLPRGTIVGIVTKGIIPAETLGLLEEHRSQVEGVAIGVASLDERRNRTLEPGCPPARERLRNVDRAAARGLATALRLDPLFPALDDAPSALERLVDEAANRGALAITATYVFAWGRYLRRLRREPMLAESCRLLTERAPMEGGTAFSVPLGRKLETYSLLSRLAVTRGIHFSTCGCKDLRVRDAGAFSTTCRNTPLLAARGLGPTRTAACPGPAGGVLPGRRAVPTP